MPVVGPMPPEGEALESDGQKDKRRRDKKRKCRIACGIVAWPMLSGKVEKTGQRYRL